MLDTKKLYGIAKIDSLELEEAKQNLEIDIKYYVTKILIGKVNSRKYGIEIIKEEKQGNTTTKERSKINGLSNNERVIKNLLELLMKNRVTPMSTEEVIDDLRRNPQVIYDMLKNKVKIKYAIKI